MTASAVTSISTTSVSSETAPVVTPAARDVWEDVLRRDPDALVTQSPAWIDAMSQAGYADVSRCYELSSGRRVVLPMVRRRGIMPARVAIRYSPPPAWGMGGLIADGPVTAEELGAIIDDLRAQPVLSTRIRPNPLHADLWSVAEAHGAIATPRVAHVVDLEGGSAAAWKRMERNARWGVSKAQRSGVTVECDTTGRLVPVFYGLLERSVERWAQFQHEPLALARWRARRRDPLGKLQSMAAALGDKMHVWVAWHEGRPAAAAIVLIGANGHDTKAAMDKEIAGPTHANDLVMWSGIEDACAAGCQHHHLGESGTSRSLGRYKEKFGARAVPYAEYRIERLPLGQTDALARGAIKRVLNFRDT
jgi:hypothetical protein